MRETNLTKLSQKTLHMPHARDICNKSEANNTNTLQRRREHTFI